MLPKPLYLLWFEHIQPPLGDILGINSALRRRHTEVLLIFTDFECSWGYRGGPTNHVFGHIFESAPFGGHLEDTGSPKDTHGHQNDIKMNPETDKMTRNQP